MQLTVVEEAGVKVVEGVPDQAVLSGAADIDLVIEACLSGGARSALLYPHNLPPAFFDLSSGDAGTILQTLRNYGIRLAVVCAPDSVRYSRRFGEMVAEERRQPYFGVFATRDAAREWLRIGRS
jgi:Domain of unknown function (DUF4180)